MKKPPPEKDGECLGCLESKPLLMPVGFIPGWPVVVWDMLCMDCRTTQQMSRHWHTYGIPAYILENSPHADQRARYAKYLAAEV